MSAKTVSEELAETASPRHWIRLVSVYLLIPLILLICGGDFGWRQAWLYSLLIVAAGIGGRMWAEQRHPGLMAERQNIENIQNAKAWDKVLAPLMAVSVGYPMVFVALLLVLRISGMARRDGLHFDRVRIRFRCMGIGREPLFLQCGAHSDGSRAHGM
jgi:hypothetical protein